MTPTQRSKKHLEDLGFVVEIVERWNPWAKVRHDLYGICDLLALGPGMTLGVQTTTYPHLKERAAKALACKHLDAMARAKWSLVVHGWKKPTQKVRRWSLGTLDIISHGVIIHAEGLGGPEHERPDQDPEAEEQ